MKCVVSRGEFIMNMKTAAAMQTKKKLKEAFISLYIKNGMSGITVNAVAKKAGCNRCTFYNHYETLQELLKEIEDEIIEQLQQVPLTISFDGYENINTFFSQMLETVELYGDTVYCLLGSNGDAAFRKRLQETIKKKFLQTTNKQIEVEKLEYLQTYVTSAVLGLVEHWYSTGKKYSTEEFLHITQALVANGAFKFISEMLNNPI